MSIDASAFRVLEQHRGQWFCVPCLSRAVGLTVPDNQHQLAGVARMIETGQLTDYETSSKAACEQCKAQGDGALRVRARR